MTRSRYLWAPSGTRPSACRHERRLHGPLRVRRIEFWRRCRKRACSNLRAWRRRVRRSNRNNICCRCASYAGLTGRRATACAFSPGRSPGRTPWSLLCLGHPTLPSQPLTTWLLRSSYGQCWIVRPATYEGRPRPGERCVVTSWQIGSEGRGGALW